jgi:hypothetical protein
VVRAGHAPSVRHLVDEHEPQAARLERVVLGPLGRDAARAAVVADLDVGALPIAPRARIGSSSPSPAWRTLFETSSLTSSSSVASCAPETSRPRATARRASRAAVGAASTTSSRWDSLGIVQ